MKTLRLLKLIVLGLAVLLTACAQTETPPPTLLAVASPIPPTASQTASPVPTATPSVTPSATPTATSTPTATPTLHPMTIAAMREREYPGSDIIVERELDPGVNYRRYYASYLSEGLTIYALLTVPNGARPEAGWPVIVFNHGYIPPTQYRTTERYIAYVDNLARNGYLVFRVDYRGHDQSEGEALGAYGNPGYVVDVLNAVASLKRYPDADPDRIGMWGHSMGGYLTLRAMVISPDIKAGVIWAGVVAQYPDVFVRGARPTLVFTGTPLPTGTPPPGRGWRTAWAEEFGTRDENPAFWDSISANAYVTEISGPVQLHHGTGDESVPWEASQQLYDQLVAAQQVVEFYSYEGDNHNLAGFFSQAMRRTVDFFDTYLKP